MPEAERPAGAIHTCGGKVIVEPYTKTGLWCERCKRMVSKEATTVIKE